MSGRLDPLPTAGMQNCGDVTNTFSPALSNTARPIASSSSSGSATARDDVLGLHLHKALRERFCRFHYPLQRVQHSAKIIRLSSAAADLATLSRPDGKASEGIAGHHTALLAKV